MSSTTNSLGFPGLEELLLLYGRLVYRGLVCLCKTRLEGFVKFLQMPSSRGVSVDNRVPFPSGVPMIVFLSSSYGTL